MVVVAGLDVGGANLKGVRLETEGDAVRGVKVLSRYLPLWKVGLEGLEDGLRWMKERLVEGGGLEGVGVTMTGELSDLFPTKREGVGQIARCVAGVFAPTPLHILDLEGGLIGLEGALEAPSSVAAANWVASGLLASRFADRGVLLDVGSTTTTLTPFEGGRVAATAKTDPEKLMVGELVYTGLLRTNIAAIVQKIPFRGGMVRVASELFSTSADAHLILGNISEGDYAVETADGRGKTLHEARARLARVVCGDLETIGDDELWQMARFVEKAQRVQIMEGLMKAASSLGGVETLAVVTAGVGGAILGRSAAEGVGAKKILDLGELLGAEPARTAPATGLAVLVAEKMGGFRVSCSRPL